MKARGREGARGWRRGRRALEIAAGIGLLFAAQRTFALAFGATDAPPARDKADKAEDAPLREHADPVTRYELRASLDPAAHTIHGEGSITWRNASSAPQSELYVHLYLNAFKNERTVFLRRKDEGFRGGGAVGDFGFVQVKSLRLRAPGGNGDKGDAAGGVDVWPKDATTPGDPDDETDIRVPLPSAVEPGASITLDVAWDSRLPSITLRTGYEGRFHMAGQWFPKIARLEADGRWAHFAFHRLSEFYADFGAYDVTVDVPEGFVVGATGRMASEERKDGRVARRFVEEDIHDFAFTAWDQFREATATSDEGVAIRCLYPPGHERSAAIELDVARAGLAHLGRAYGRYPYATLTIVHPPEGATEAGGMEYPTLITTGGEWYLPWTGARLVEDVTIHELAHQWFYGLVATNEHAYPFLDEGLATYAEIDAMEALFPGASVASAPGLPASIGLAAAHRAVSMEADQNAIVAQSAAAFETGFDYGALVYGRTATALNSLANVYGEDVIRGAIGLYARRHRFGHPAPDELLAAIRERAGDVAAEALRVALFERGWVDYAVDDFAYPSAPPGSAPRGIFGPPDKPVEAPSAPLPSASLTSVLVRRRGSIVLPVDVDFIGEDGSIERVQWDAKESAAWLTYSGSAPLAAVVVDPSHRMLLDKDLANNARRVAASSIALRVLEKGVFASELGLLIASP